VGFLASLFSFGVLVAFTAAQLAVLKLRFSKPDLERPFRVPLSIRIRGADVPVPTVLGALATMAIFVAAMATHIGAPYGGPIVLGSAPKWRRQSRFFSPTVDYVLRKAPAEVLVVAFPQGVLEGV